MMGPEFSLLLFVGVVVIATAHELVHVVIARRHGYPVICVAINPIGVMLIFEDAPVPRYWLLQFTLPLLVTWALGYLWLLLLMALLGVPEQLALLAGRPDVTALATGVVALATSGGDLVAFVMELRKPLWGDERVLRDFRILRKLPALVHFLAAGRRWQPTWESLARKSSTRSSS
jgi:hypothetical protein